jgi:hypothetical protein
MYERITKTREFTQEKGKKFVTYAKKQYLCRRKAKNAKATIRNRKKLTHGE